MSNLNISWSEYHHKIEILAAKIYQSGWQFNQIICIAKGGLRVGDILCRIYDQPLGILAASSYTGVGNRVQGEICFSQHISMTNYKLGNRILLVDDLVDSGVSLSKSIEWLQERFCQEISEIRTAVIWYKSCSQFKPNYYVDYLSDNPWICQPFEYYEQITPAELAQKYLITCP